LLHLAGTLAGIGHWRADFSTGTFEWSEQACSILGFPPDVTVTADLWRSHVHPDDLELYELRIADARRTGRMPQTRLRWTRPDGRVIHVLSASEADGPDRAIGILRDVTTELEIERSLIATRDQARAAERAKAELLAVMSHEVRSPLNGLLNSIESLRRNPSEAQRQPVLQALSEAAVSVMRVVDDMLDFSRVESGRVVIESVNFDLKAVVRTTVDLYNGTAAAKGLGLVAHGLEGEPVIVRGDSARVQQLLSNLVGNAIKFTEHGAVSIGLSPT